MASIPSSSSSLRERVDLSSIRALVLRIDQHINGFLSDYEARRSVQLNCSSMLKTHKQEFFEFSEQSVLSNLYWGIENFESALQAKCEEVRTVQLMKTEQMLQIPALLDEYGNTSGIANKHLMCFSYFYLSLIRKLQGDGWQMTLHFLQALLVSPNLVRKKFTPDLWELLFPTRVTGENGNLCLTKFQEEAIDDATRRLARRYKDWMMYYRVILYGETPKWLLGDTVANFNEEKPGNHLFHSSACTEFLESPQGNIWPDFPDVEMEYPRDVLESTYEDYNGKAQASTFSYEENIHAMQGNGGYPQTKFDEICHQDMKENLCPTSLDSILNVSHSDTSISFHSIIDSAEGSNLEENAQNKDSKVNVLTTKPCVLASEACDREDSLEKAPLPESLGYLIHRDTYEENASSIFSSRSPSSGHDVHLSILEMGCNYSSSGCNCIIDEEAKLQRSVHCDLSKMGHHRRISSETFDTHLNLNDGDYTGMLGGREKTLLKLCSSIANLEVSTMWEILRKSDGKCNLVKVDVEQLISVISISKEDQLVRASMSIILVLLSENRNLIEDIKRLIHLYDLACALKRNVHEAAVLIYLLNPSPIQLKELELLPALVETTCNSNSSNLDYVPLPLTPSAAAVALIENLVTKLGIEANNLAILCTPPILSRLVNVTCIRNVDEGTSVVSILVSCMRFDENCRNYLSQITPLGTFLHFLQSSDQKAKLTALEYFHEILRLPRSSATNLLYQMRQVGSMNIMYALMACIQQEQSDHHILAANLLLQLDAVEDLGGKSIFREEAVEVLLEAVTSEGSPDMQVLSAFVLSNLGGTFSDTGEPYTAAWLLQKMGLSSSCHRNMIKHFDWSDKALQDNCIDEWCRKIGKSLLKIGDSVFHALKKGLQSKVRSVSRDCLVTIAWLGCEIEAGSAKLRQSACETLLSSVEQFLHSGLELEERLLACMCLYNYTSVRGIQNLMSLSEGLRESLRRLSSITWMAEDLLKHINSVLPRKTHVSCVHTQILEAGNLSYGAVNSLLYYKGLLCTGHPDGSIKVWDIKGQTAKYAWEVKAHKKQITCVALFEPGDSLLTGSSDKTVKVWQMKKQKLECVQVIEMKDPIHKIDSCGLMIFIITQSRGLKVYDGSRNLKTICKSKRFTSIAVTQGKIHLGCTDASIQVVSMMNDQVQEIKAPEKRWWINKRPINAISFYNDWVYGASDAIHMSNLKRHHCGSQCSMTSAKGTNLLSLAVVEDFIYIQSSTSPSSLQIWLRGNHRQVGRLSAGCRITSLFTANDIVFCGTETGLIKAWAPL